MSASLLSALAIGFLLGLRHATDSDHVIAVSAIASREGSVLRALRIGAAWGIGHSVTLMLVGGSIILFRLSVPARLGLGFEFLVALMLIALGLATLARPSSTGSVSMRWPIAVGFV